MRATPYMPHRKPESISRICNAPLWLDNRRMNLKHLRDSEMVAENDAVIRAAQPRGRDEGFPIRAGGQG